MAAAKAFLARFGLMSRVKFDSFDLRLARIGRREQNLRATPILFKNRRLHSEA